MPDDYLMYAAAFAAGVVAECYVGLVAKVRRLVNPPPKPPTAMELAAQKWLEQQSGK